MRDQQGRRAPLPLLLIDTDIYGAAPSVLLGTIDKLALPGENVRTIERHAGMFGMGSLCRTALPTSHTSSAARRLRPGHGCCSSG